MTTQTQVLSERQYRRKEKKESKQFIRGLVTFNILLGVLAIIASIYIMTAVQDTIDDMSSQITTLESKLEYTVNSNADEIATYQAKITMYEDMLDGYKEYMASIGVSDEDVAKTTTQETAPAVTTNQIVFNPNNVTQLSNASAETLDAILEGTRLEGYGWLYNKMENIYGVNVIYAIANSFQEAGYSGENSYTARNNIYGLMNKSFGSIDECIVYYFKLISNHYVDKKGLTSISNIGTVYCPTDSSWDDDIISIGTKLQSTATATMS